MGLKVKLHFMPLIYQRRGQKYAFETLFDKKCCQLDLQNTAFNSEFIMGHGLLNAVNLGLVQYTHMVLVVIRVREYAQYVQDEA
jgi:hypothetical protein